MEDKRTTEVLVAVETVSPDHAGFRTAGDNDTSIRGMAFLRKTFEEIRIALNRSREESKVIEDEKKKAFDAIRFETESNERYMEDQTEARGEKLKDLLEQCRNSECKLESVLSQLTEIALAPLATIEFGQESAATQDQKEGVS